MQSLKDSIFLNSGAAIIVCRRRVLNGVCSLVVFLDCLYIKPKETAIISSMQCKLLTIDVSCFIW